MPFTWKELIQGTVAFWRHFAWKQRGYHKYGLYHDDIIWRTPEVVAAYARMPQSMKDEVQWRYTRAFHCSMKKTYLPKEYWTDYYDDLKNGRYLQPYVEEVVREHKEQKEWNAH